MARTVKEQLDQVERDLELWTGFDASEKARFNRESHLWTAEDRIAWQELQSDCAQKIRELHQERDVLRRQLSP